MTDLLLLLMGISGLMCGLLLAYGLLAGALLLIGKRLGGDE